MRTAPNLSHANAVPDHQDVDRAAVAGFDSFATGKRMPSWVLKDQLLIDAWNIGRRQAADRAGSR